MIFTTDEIQSNLITNAFHREVEIHQYQVNIDNYTLMLQSLPEGEWDSDIVQYKDTQTVDLPHSLSDSDVERISDFQYRDKIRSLLRSEKAEQSKTQRVLDVLKGQIVGDYETLIQQFKSQQ